MNAAVVRDLPIPFEPASARRQAECVLQEWSAGLPPDTQAALSRFPELRLDKSIVLDLAYEEYCLRRERGEELEIEAYCDAYADHRMSLRRLIDAHRFLEECQPQLSAPPQFRWPACGETFEGYHIVRQLGRGAFARVYLAWDEAVGSQVVVKVSVGDAAEARLAGPLDNPAIMPVKHARSLTSGASYVVMPFLGCVTLHDLLDAARSAPSARQRTAQVFLKARDAAVQPADKIPRDEARDRQLANTAYTDFVADLVANLARGLAFLHEHGIRHRDLKPSNVLLRWDGRPVILDFNLSEDAAADLPRCGGTLPYMAPEQIHCALKTEAEPTFDERADVFSLGVIGYELLTGSHPFGVPAPPPSQKPLRLREAANCLLGWQRSGFPPLRTRAAEVDPTLAHLLERCLSFEPSERPTARAVADGIDRSRRWPARLKRSMRRHRFGAAAAGLCLVLCLGAAVAIAASRPSFDERAYQRAVMLLRQGQAEKSEEMLDELIKRDRGNARLWYLRGLARLHRTEFADGQIFADAQSDFDRAYAIAPDGPTAAFISYCMSSRQEHASAIHLSEQAEKYGIQTAGLFSNRSYSYVRGLPQMGLKEKMEKALRNADEAIRRDPCLPAAYYNRGEIHYRIWLDGKNPEHLSRARLDMEKLLESEPLSAVPYALAANMFASSPQSVRADRIVELLRKAADRGVDPRPFKDYPNFVRLVSRQDFQEVIRQAPGPLRTPLSPGLVEPIADPIP
jgi:serine/threonine protein kinase